ncbi:MAG: triphosphoribosyl-dephospho-CoA synthase, partial [Methyloceanibacter sp.]
FLESAAPGRLAPELMDFDRALKAGGLNPGTSADLTVATVFAHALQVMEKSH